MSKINRKRFHLSGPPDLAGRAWGWWPPRKFVANRPLPDDHMLRHEMARHAIHKSVGWIRSGSAGK
jgi:hypothetical protein